MYLEILKSQLGVEARKNYIESLSQDDRIKLYDEIKKECDANEKEFIANQAKIQQYEQELQNELNNLKELNLNSLEELHAEINRLDTELTNKCLEYTSIIEPKEVINEPTTIQSTLQ